MNNVTNNAKQEFFYRIIALMLIFINIFLIIYLLFGFGKVSINNNQVSVFYVNENRLDSTKSISLRPGKYTIRVANKDISSEPKDVWVWPFITNKIQIEKSNPSNIFKYSNNKPLTAGEIELLSSEYSKDQNWLVAKYLEKDTGNQYTMIFKYTLDQWQNIAYYPNESNEMDDENILLVPDDVIAIYNRIKQPGDED